MDQAEATRAIVTVGLGRGFIVSATHHYIITAGHCLPSLPPANANSDESRRMYAGLLGSLGEKPTVCAECVFVDPIADIAVLGAPDEYSLFHEAEEYRELMESAVPLPIADSPPDVTAWLLSLDGLWFPCSVQHHGGMLRVSNATKGIVGGMSGSPIVADDGSADGPHCITWTHAEEVNSELASFLGKGAAQGAVSAPQHEAVA
jgi:S1-C subfamily serine protease